MRIKIFITWSGRRGKMLAEALHEWARHTFHQCDPWVSSHNIRKGDRWFSTIGRALEDHHVGFICVTPENLQAPWLNFEAGALSKSVDDARVCPVLFGLSPGDLKGSPLEHFQATETSRDEMQALADTLNELLGQERLDTGVLRRALTASWNDLSLRLDEISRFPLSRASEALPSVLRALSRRGMPDPKVGDVVFFESGFESHSLYAAACELATNRLWVYGRKNRKFFDKEYADFFKDLPGKVEAGLDFRCLFMHPQAPPHVVEAAHSDPSFPQDLEKQVKKAVEMIEGAGMPPNKFLRGYLSSRFVAMVVIDDTVIYTPVRRDRLGKAKALTKANCAVVSDSTELGSDLVHQFIDVWEGSDSLPISEGDA